MRRSPLTKIVDNISYFKKRILHWSKSYSEVIYLDSNLYTQQYSSFDTIVALGQENHIESDYINAFEDCKNFYDKTGDWIFGYFGYGLSNEGKSLNLNTTKGSRLGFSDLYFLQPKKIIFIKGNKVTFSYLSKYKSQAYNDFLDILSTELPQKNISNKRITLSCRLSKEEYSQKVKEVLNHVQKGDIYELNFCTEFFSQTSILPFEVFEKLNQISKSPFSAFMKLQHLYIMCSSPERFLKKIGDKIISQPIKGTARRIKDDRVNHLIKTNLESNLKERSENIMNVDLVRNDLSKIAKPNSVKVKELCQVYSFSHVHQLISTVVCEALDNMHPVDIIKHISPIASMTGVPKLKAIEIIDRLETSKREVYSGSLGYFSPKGDFDFNVIIRTILYNDIKKYLSISAGGAITSRSSIEDEYEEILLKIESQSQSLN